MVFEKGSLSELAARLRRGDPAAAVEWQQQLERPMVRIVRRVMRCQPRDGLAQWLRAEVSRLIATGRHRPASSEGLVDHIARQLCSMLIGQRLEAAGSRLLAAAPGGSDQSRGPESSSAATP